MTHNIVIEVFSIAANNFIGEEKEVFLLLLRDNPEKLRLIVKKRIEDVGLLAALHWHVLDCNFELQSQRVLESFQKEFADQIAILSTASSARA